MGEKEVPPPSLRRTQIVIEAFSNVDTENRLEKKKGNSKENLLLILTIAYSSFPYVFFIIALWPQ